MVDDSFQVIVATGLSPRANPSDEVQPLLNILKENVGGISRKMAITTDAGCFNETNVMLLRTLCSARLGPQSR